MDGRHGLLLSWQVDCNGWPCEHDHHALPLFFVFLFLCSLLIHSPFLHTHNALAALYTHTIPTRSWQSILDATSILTSTPGQAHHRRPQNVENVDGAMWRRFCHHREVVALSVLEAARRQHSAVRPLLDGSGRSTGLIMPLMALGSLDRFLRGVCEPMTLLEVCRTVALDLHHVHQAGVLHLDIRTDNIAVRADVSGSPVAQLIDFGNATCPVLAACPALTLSVPASTSLHTAGWVAPELLDVHRMCTIRPRLDGVLLPWTQWVSASADVYALGSVLPASQSTLCLRAAQLRLLRSAASLGL